MHLVAIVGNVLALTKEQIDSISTRCMRVCVSVPEGVCDQDHLTKFPNQFSTPVLNIYSTDETHATLAYLGSIKRVQTF